MAAFLGRASRALLRALLPALAITWLIIREQSGAYNVSAASAAGLAFGLLNAVEIVGWLGIAGDVASLLGLLVTFYQWLRRKMARCAR